MIVRLILLVFVLIPVTAAEPKGEEDIEFAANLFQNTFKIVGQKGGGTIWAIGRQITSNAMQGVFITANHVLDAIPEDDASIIARKHEGTNWLTMRLPLHIRDSSKPLWTKHPSADVAAIKIPALFRPFIIKPVPEAYLGTDEDFKTMDVSPGDEIFVPGFPFLIPTKGEFPILRRGVLASYPLIPMKEAQMFYIDCPIFAGNSGGVVFYKSRFIGRGVDVRMGQFQFILGIVVQAASVDELATYGEIRLPTKTQVGLATVVPAVFIQETLDLMPKPSVEELKNAPRH